jgi:hypothetical protein
VPSAAEEERALGDPAAAYAPADAAAAAVALGEALGGAGAVCARLCASPHIAASGPLRQLQLLRAAWAWVLRHAAPPPPQREAGSGGGADACGGRPLGTWHIGCPLFEGGDAAAAKELEQVRAAPRHFVR